MTEKFLPKFRINLRNALFIFLVSTVLSSLTVNIILLFSKDKLAHKASSSLTHSLKIGNIFYIPPDILLVQDLKIISQNADAGPARLPLIGLKFSLADLIFRQRVSVPAIAINEVFASRAFVSKFIHENGEHLASILRSLPKADILFLIKEAQLHFPQGAVTNTLHINLAVQVKGEEFYAKGNIYQPEDLSPFILHANGRLTPRGTRLNQFSLERPKFYSNFWGEIRDGVLDISGYAFSRALDEIHRPGILERLSQNTSKAVTEPTIELIDVKCRARLEFPTVKVEHLNFVLNNFPFSSSGTIVLSPPAKLDLAASLFNAPSGSSHIKNFKQANLLLNGSFTPKGFLSRSELNFLFEQSKDASFTLDKINISASDLLLYYDFRQTAQLNKGAVTFTTLKAPHRISFDNLKMSFNFEGEKFKIIDIVAALYGGSLQGRVWVDPTQFPLRVTASAIFKEAEANALEELLVHFSKIHGSLSGKLLVKSHPNFDLAGELLIRNGSLRNFDFFKWMAETFVMPSLVNIPFGETTARFWVNHKGSGLTDLQINSPDVSLTGYFNVDKSSLVSSKLSLGLSRGILQESPKFRAILRMFEQDIPSLFFDFQLSGNQDAMNFKWLQSEFKQRIQDRIPNFVERMIDRKIDTILEGKTVEEQEPSAQ